MRATDGRSPRQAARHHLPRRLRLLRRGLRGRISGPGGLNTENEPSAKQIATLIRQIKKEGTRALFVENTSDPRLIKRIADEAGGVVGGTLYSDALAPAGQTGDSYIGLFRYNVPALAAAMAKN